MGTFRVKDGVRPSDAIQDIFKNPKAYGFECADVIGGSRENKGNPGIGIVPGDPQHPRTVRGEPHLRHPALERGEAEHRVAQLEELAVEVLQQYRKLLEQRREAHVLPAALEHLHRLQESLAALAAPRRSWV